VVGDARPCKSIRRVMAACLLLLAVGGAVALAQVAFHGNVKTHIFHRSGCRYYNCGACSAVFDSRDAAIKAGFRPCQVCNP
jgi:hypothetical protein